MFYRVALISVFLSGLAACSSMKGPDTSTAEGAFQLGEKFEKDERFEEAITQFNSVKNKHPYSKLAAEAELHIANIHYDREDFIEAQNSYQAFKELHPTHPKIDFVTFRLAMSFFNQLPSTIDRDLALATRAIQYFDETINSHPNSEFVAQAKDYKAKAIKMLAEKENYIAYYYFKRDIFGSALTRYEDLLKNYPNQGLDAEALYGAAVSAFETKDLSKAKEYFDRLVNEYPNSSEVSRARSKFGNKL